MINVTFEASIYIWFSLQYEFIYIGETNNKLGIVARAYEHINEGGTLWKQVYNRIGVDLYKVNDLILCNFPLPNERRYNTKESIYRFAVEYLVQRNIIENRGKLAKMKSLKIISNVKSNDYVEKKEVIKVANEICEEFGRKILQLA